MWKNVKTGMIRRKRLPWWRNLSADMQDRWGGVGDGAEHGISSDERVEMPDR